MKKKIIGVSAFVSFATYKAFKDVPARIDTGARTSSLWATNIRIANETVSFCMFGPESELFTGKRITLPLEGVRKVTSSNGQSEDRYIIKMRIKLNGRRFIAKFTLSSRNKQSYPILIGRNTLRGNFLVDSMDAGEAPIYKDLEERDEYLETEAA